MALFITVYFFARSKYYVRVPFILVWKFFDGSFVRLDLTLEQERGTDGERDSQESKFGRL